MTRAALGARLGRVGVWSLVPQSDRAPAARELALEIEELGFDALWSPEALDGLLELDAAGRITTDAAMRTGAAGAATA
jgi:alkanesulfonate monooxygenase SsuD/methylene tetrahydromethanopterin reductase-like flavin-dependent oxidoreductase (luciferase family)